MFQRISGTRDILPEEVSWWQKIEAISHNVFSLYQYREIRPPLLEEAALFNRSLGESTEIVQKQMFLVERDKDTYALRPEGTASIVRAYLENHFDKKNGFTKLYYIGPMFRAERPQKGRLRQFHHIGCEAIGSSEADLDVEIISLADNLLKNFSISGYKIKINSLGCNKDKRTLRDIISAAFKDKLAGLCADCQSRYKNNPLRILDCKNQECLELIKKIDIQQKHLCPECKTHFEIVKEGLDSLRINYTVIPTLVRGLDYYTRTVFEISHDNLGSQDALCAGGRYDKLVSQLGGPDLGAIGFAFGMERLFLVSNFTAQPPKEKLAYLIALGKEAKKETLKLLDKLRKSGISADADYENKSLKGAMRKAHDLGANYVLILGEDELKKNVMTLKDMVSGEQKEVKQEDLIPNIKNQISKTHSKN